jgi:putative transposase
VRLKAGWEEEYKGWCQRDLSTKAYVYWWADGIYFNVRLDEERSCVLVLIGALADGTKELLAVVDGYRESTQSWRELLQQLKRQGLQTAPKLTIGDGSLGFWLALREEYGPVAQQRCWVHKTANILDKMPKSVQGRAKQLIHEMYLSPTRKAALAAYDQFIDSYQAKYPKATECLAKDKEWLFTFYDFPAQHWSHLRTTNPIESTFATVRLRTQRTKGCGSRIATLTMVFKLGTQVQQHWRRLLERIRIDSESRYRSDFCRRRRANRTSGLTLTNQGCAYSSYTTFDNISYGGQTSGDPSAPVDVELQNGLNHLSFF